jgi:hypothetical protein
MNTIDHLNSHATVTETADISNSVSAAIESATLTDEFLTRETPLLKSKAAAMVAGIGAERGKAMKDDVDETDALRDSKILALTMFLRAYIIWNNASTNEAANTLLRIIKSHGRNIIHASYEKESALLDSILGEFEKPIPAAALVTLNLTTLAGELKAAQTRFKELYLQSATLESGKANVIAPTSIRKETIEVLNTIVDYLNVMYTVSPRVYNSLTNKIAELVNSLNTKIRTRHTIQITEALKNATDTAK